VYSRNNSRDKDPGQKKKKKRRGSGLFPLLEDFGWKVLMLGERGEKRNPQ
jgi:hypothetical protein